MPFLQCSYIILANAQKASQQVFNTSPFYFAGYWAFLFSFKAQVYFFQFQKSVVMLVWKLYI